MPGKSTNNTIRFFFNDIAFGLKNRRQLKSSLLTLFKNEGLKLSSLNFIFCSDQSLLKINQQYLHHDFYTDIITFDLSEPGEPGISGEIYISVPRVKENALKLNQSFKREIHRVIFHGALHLCGYNDKTKNEVATMRGLEEKYLSLYFDDK